MVELKASKWERTARENDKQFLPRKLCTQAKTVYNLGKGATSSKCFLVGMDIYVTFLACSAVLPLVATPAKFVASQAYPAHERLSSHLVDAKKRGRK